MSAGGPFWVWPFDNGKGTPRDAEHIDALTAQQAAEKWASKEYFELGHTDKAPCYVYDVSDMTVTEYTVTIKTEVKVKVRRSPL